MNLRLPAFETSRLPDEPYDAESNLHENMRCFAAAVGFLPEALYQVHQVHGKRTLGATGSPPWLAEQEADALMLCPDTSPPHSAVGVRTADCVPILLAHTETRVVAAIHAGWRGVVEGVVTSALKSLLRRGGSRHVIAALGPCIEPCCFEVDEVVAKALSEASSPAVVVSKAASLRVDLRHAVRLQLQRGGVLPDAIDDVGGCTSCQPSLFFSHRRDGRLRGSHLSVIRG